MITTTCCTNVQTFKTVVNDSLESMATAPSTKSTGQDFPIGFRYHAENKLCGKHMFVADWLCCLLLRDEGTRSGKLLSGMGSHHHH